MNTTIDYLKWLWTYLRFYKKWLCVAFLSMFFYSAVEGSILLGMRKVIQHIRKETEPGAVQTFAFDLPEVPLVGIGGGEWIVAQGSSEEILVTLTYYGLGILTVLVVTEFLKLTVMDIIGIGISRDIRGDLFDNIIRRPLAFFEQTNVGDLMSRLSSDVNRINKSVSGALKYIIQCPLEIIIIGGIDIYLAPYLSMIFFVMIPLCTYIVYYVGEKIKRYSRASQDVFGDLQSRIQERFSGIKLVKSEVNEEREIEEFKGQNNSHYRKERRKKFANASMRGTLHLIVYGAALGLMFLGGHFIIEGFVPFENFAILLGSMVWIYQPIRKLSGVNQKIQDSRGAAERIDHIFSEESRTLSELEEGEREPEFNESIEMRGVSFKYEQGDEPVLTDLDITVERGDRIGIVGQSGAGKSTLVDLFLRFYDPTEGTITLDGVPLSEFRLEPYRNMFGLVTQHTILFDDTLANNIRYGRADIGRDRVQEAAREAQAMKFIEDCPEGLDTMIGEKGVRLSGGERQRVALARALVTQPEVLVLDEATSNIDSRSEQLILESIEQLPGEMTVISISHALPSVQFADRIIVLSDRTIEAAGTHDELLETSSTYKKLYNLQVDEFETAF